MIVVKLELWPEGEEKNKKNIGRLLIWNKENGTEEKGNYAGIVSKAFNFPGMNVEILNHSRKLSPYHLLFKILNKTLGGIAETDKCPACFDDALFADSKVSENGMVYDLYRCVSCDFSHVRERIGG